jgi:hypothetical protein
VSPSDALLHLLLIPAAAAGVLAAASALLPEGPRGGFVAAFAVAAGFVAGCWALGARPALPLASSDDAWTWTLWLAVLGAIVGGLEAGGGPTGPPLLVARFLASALGAALVLGALHPQPLGTPAHLLRAALFGAGGASLWTVGVAVSRRRTAAAWLPAIAVALGGATFLLLRAGRSAAMAQAAATLATAVLTVAAVRGLRRRSPLPAPTAASVALPYAGLLAAAHGYLSYGSVERFPAATAAALLLAPCAGALAASRLAKTRTVAALVAGTVALAVVGLGALAAPLGDE